MDAENEVEKLKKLKKQIRKPRYARSRLDAYRDELRALRAAGATQADLVRWLRMRRVKVAHSTVQRWFARHG